MENLPRYMTGLRYDGFSLIYMFTFGVESFNPQLFDKEFITSDANHIDEQIFAINEGDDAPVQRYSLPGFDVNVTMDSPYEVKLSGHIYVELSVFFNCTVTLTFRMLVDGSSEACKIDKAITTDHLIALAALNLGAEHWNCDNNKTCSNINLDVLPVCISDLHIDENGNWVKKGLSLVDNGDEAEPAVDGNSFDKVCIRYEKAIVKSLKTVANAHQHFVYVDIWETVDNYDGSLQKMPLEEDMITFIEQKCKSEMVGLMTLYPKEWPYRTEESYKDVCGDNIAIDTDDLILLNSSMCVVFGTYGRRGKNSPTDWTEHLKERSHYHVSWPEYMLILEMVLAKKYTIAQANRYLIKSTLVGEDTKTVRNSIENNSAVEISITKLLLKLDAVNYSKFMSHKVMFDRTIKRLDVEKDMENLSNVMGKVEAALNNLSEMRSLKQSHILNVVLGCISVASLFQVIFADVEIPFLKKLGISWASDAGFTLVGISIFLVFVGLLAIGIVYLQNVGVSGRLIETMNKYIKDKKLKKDVEKGKNK